MQMRAKITSKGQITIPREIRRALGVKEGDKLVFERQGSGFSMFPVKDKSAFAKYRGIGNSGRATGRAAIVRTIREMRDPETGE